jgi:outer membrane protein TolC
LLKSFINPGNTELLFEAPTGQELRPAILQIIDFPTVTAQQYKSQKKLINLNGSEKKVTQNQLIFSVKAQFNLFQFNLDKTKTLTIYDSILSDLLEVNDVRFRVGQISSLEKLNGEAKYKLIQNQLLQANVDVKSSKYNFSLLLGKPGDTTFFPSQGLTKRINSLDQKVSVSDIDKNPLVEYYEKQMDLNKSLLKVERNKRLPGLMFGYYNQADANTPLSLVSRLRFGVLLPIWFWTNQSKIKGAKKAVEISETQMQVNSMNLVSQYAQAVAQYEQYQQSLNYFESVGLRQAEEIIKNAQTSFKAGSIGYYFYLQNLDQAFQIRLSYLEALKNYNQSILTLEYLSGNNN